MTPLRIPLLLLAITLGSIAVAQGAPDPCNKVKSHADAFGVVTRGTRVNLDPAGYTMISITQQDGKSSIAVMTVLSGVSDVHLEAGQELRFAVGGKPVVLKSRERADPVANANSATAFTQWVLVADISAEAMAAFAQDPIAAVQLKVGSIEMELPVKKGNGKKLLATARCLAK